MRVALPPLQPLSAQKSRVHPPTFVGSVLPAPLLDRPHGTKSEPRTIIAPIRVVEVNAAGSSSRPSVAVDVVGEVVDVVDGGEEARVDGGLPHPVSKPREPPLHLPAGKGRRRLLAVRERKQARPVGGRIAVAARRSRGYLEVAFDRLWPTSRNISRSVRACNPDARRRRPSRW